MTLKVVMAGGSGAGLRWSKNWPYRVLGLPAGRQAWVREFNNNWQVLQVTDGTRTETEEYASVHDALVALMSSP